MKEPRCFARYINDRVCDICSFTDKCIGETDIRLKIELEEWRCKHKKWDENSNTPLCKKFVKTKFFCKGDIDCFPQLIRKMKLEKIKKL
jgi:hypothetical protein